MRAVAAPEVAALRAELFFLSPGLPRARAHLAEARAAADEALREDPAQPLALAVLLALPEGGNAAPSLERIRAAAAEWPGDFRAQMLLAFAVGPGSPRSGARRWRERQGSLPTMPPSSTRSPGTT